MLVCLLQATGESTSSRSLFIEKKSAPHDDIVLDVIVTLCAHVATDKVKQSVCLCVMYTFHHPLLKLDYLICSVSKKQNGSYCTHILVLLIS